MEREDIENMVKAMMLETLKPVLRDISEVRARIIGIDGNGTGRDGALQRQDKKLQQLDDGQIFIIKQLGELTKHAETWSKAKFWKFTKWAIVTIISMLVLMLGYLSYRETLHVQGKASIISPHAEVQSHSSDAGVDLR